MPFFCKTFTNFKLLVVKWVQNHPILYLDLKQILIKFNSPRQLGYQVDKPQ